MRASVVQAIGNTVIGGSEMHLVSLVEGLRSAEIDVPLVVTPGRGPLTRILREKQIPFTHVEIGTGDHEIEPDLDTVRRLAELFQELRPDVVHAHLYPAQVHVSLAAYLVGIPTVTTMHRLEPMRAGSLALPALVGSHTIAVCEAVAEALVAGGVPRGLVTTIYNSVTPDRFELRPDRAGSLRERLGAAHRPLVGTVARLSPEKGVEVLVRAVPHLLREVPDLLVVVAGYGPSVHQLRNLAGEMGVRDHVVFLGTRRDVHELNQAVDVFALASHSEACPIALLDAMAAGAACVATRVGGIPEILEDRVHGRLVRANDPETLANAICDLLCDPRERSRLGALARERVAGTFTMEKMVRTTGLLYERLRSEPKPAAPELRRRRERLPEIVEQLRSATHGKPVDGPAPTARTHRISHSSVRAAVSVRRRVKGSAIER